MRRLSTMVMIGGLAWTTGGSALAQTAGRGRGAAAPPSAFRVLSVKEMSRLELKTSSGFVGNADAGEGRRYVVVQLAFSNDIREVDNKMLVITGDDGTVYPSDGLGDETGKYCAMPGITIEREADGFRGLCGMTTGGPVSLSWIEPKQPTAAFVVPQSVPLTALRISYQQRPGVRLKL